MCLVLMLLLVHGTECVCACLGCYQRSDSVLHHFEPVVDDALGVVLHQILAALTSLQLHTNTTVTHSPQHYTHITTVTTATNPHCPHREAGSPQRTPVTTATTVAMIGHDESGEDESMHLKQTVTMVTQTVVEPLEQTVAMVTDGIPLERSSWMTFPWRPSSPRLLSARRCIQEQSVRIYSGGQEVISGTSQSE